MCSAVFDVRTTPRKQTGRRFETPSVEASKRFHAVSQFFTLFHNFQLYIKNFSHVSDYIRKLASYVYLQEDCQSARHPFAIDLSVFGCTIIKHVSTERGAVYDFGCYR